MPFGESKLVANGIDFFGSYAFDLVLVFGIKPISWKIPGDFISYINVKLLKKIKRITTRKQLSMADNKWEKIN